MALNNGIMSGLLIAFGVLLMVGAPAMARSLASYYQDIAARTPRVRRAGLWGPATNVKVWTVLCRVVAAFAILLGILTLTGVIGFL